MNKHALDCMPPGALVGGLTSEQRIPIIDEEQKTHTHLKSHETLQAGDVYGGKDWGFLYTLSKGGVPASRVGMGYRPRRPR